MRGPVGAETSITTQSAIREKGGGYTGLRKEPHPWQPMVHSPVITKNGIRKAKQGSSGRVRSRGGSRSLSRTFRSHILKPKGEIRWNFIAEAQHDKKSSTT